MATSTPVVTLEQEKNPWQAAAARFDFAAKKLNLDPGIFKILSYPTREIIVHIPVQMDDGTIEVFTGYRVQHYGVSRHESRYRSLKGSSQVESKANAPPT